VGEFLTMMGVFQVSTWAAFGAATGVILSAAYALWLYRRVVFGDLIKESLKPISDMTPREMAVIAPLVFFTLLLGVYPSLATDMFAPTVAALLENVQAAQAALADTSLAQAGTTQ
jgi:NADH-quinone oxidoreductase subunit M